VLRRLVNCRCAGAIITDKGADFAMTEKRFRHERGHDGHRLNLDPADWRAHMTSSGEWRSIEGKVAGLAFCCPCGCGLEGWLPVNVEHGWQWDGNDERPTLTPSIKNPCAYHGYLKDGYFTPSVL
jgi:uncharacterized protein DUF6527